MSEKSKLILLIGIICCGVGVLLTGVGVALGGTGYVMNADLNRLSGSAKRINGEEIIRREREQLPEFNSLKMDMDLEDIRIENSEDENFYLSYPIWKTEDEKGEKLISYEVKDGVLDLKGKNTNNRTVYIGIDIGNFFRRAKDEESNKLEDTIVLYIPKEKMMDSVTIDLDTGDLQIDALVAKKIYLNSDLGDMKLTKLSVAKGEINKQDGDVSIEDSKLQNIKFSSGIGNLNLKNVSWNTGSIKTEDGDTKMNASNLQNIEFSSSIGELDLRNTVWKSGSIILQDGDMETEQFEPSGEIKIESSMGAITIDIKKSMLEKVSLDVQTHDGEIKISDNLGGKLREKEDSAIFLKNVEGENGKLVIESYDGDIEIR